MPCLPFHPARSRRLIAPALLAAALTAAGCGTATPALTQPDRADAALSTADGGELAALFRVTLLDGTTFDLAEHLSRDGRPVVLSLWAPDCAECLEEMPGFQEASRRHPEVLILGIAVAGDAAACSAAAAAAGADYLLGIDTEGLVAAAFPAPQLPATFLIDGAGYLVGVVHEPLDPAALDQLITRHLSG